MGAAEIPSSLRAPHSLGLKLYEWTPSATHLSIDGKEGNQGEGEAEEEGGCWMFKKKM